VPAVCRGCLATPVLLFNNMSPLPSQPNSLSSRSGLWGTQEGGGHLHGGGPCCRTFAELKDAGDYLPPKAGTCRSLTKPRGRARVQAQLSAVTNCFFQLGHHTQLHSSHHTQLHSSHHTQLRSFSILKLKQTTAGDTRQTSPRTCSSRDTLCPPSRDASPPHAIGSPLLRAECLP
jgi:hypothetical protein